VVLWGTGEPSREFLEGADLAYGPELEVSLREHERHRLQQDLDVEPQRPVGAVEVVDLESAQAQGRFAAPLDAWPILYLARRGSTWVARHATCLCRAPWHASAKFPIGRRGGGAGGVAATTSKAAARRSRRLTTRAGSTPIHVSSAIDRRSVIGESLYSLFCTTVSGRTPPLSGRFGAGSSESPTQAAPLPELGCPVGTAAP
jgi:hypothetical protein